ncbi:putative orfan [Tupanvirus soda lake]|uniref:Orfan n=2 Tax=Tupanvirus TaxID=2094720 RepID=A0AC62ADZ0_9VIRU|nr:putative orfan [Tupanvirus soda lake]QKU35843.1 putative orfan [Tupanvirus soda lake]
MDQFGEIILETLLNKLSLFDDLTIFKLHKSITAEMHKRLDNFSNSIHLDRDNANESTGNFIDRELKNSRYDNNEYDDYDCNCEYECGGECSKNKPKLSVEQQRILKKNLDRELDEYMQEYDE